MHKDGRYCRTGSILDGIGWECYTTLHARAHEAWRAIQEAQIRQALEAGGSVLSSDKARAWEIQCAGVQELQGQC